MGRESKCRDGQPERGNMQNLIATLTERELEVYDLLCTGQTNQQIADNLYLSLATVKYHLKNIFVKLGVETRGAAIAYGQGSREIDHPTIAPGQFDEKALRQAAKVLVELGLGDRKVVNDVVLNLLGVLGGKIK